MQKERGTYGKKEAEAPVRSQMIGHRSLFAQQQKNIGFKFTLYAAPRTVCWKLAPHTVLRVSSLAAAQKMLLASTFRKR